jgi:hypothetical protein
MPISERSLISHIHHPNQIEQQEFSYRNDVQQVSESSERSEKHQISF